MKRTAEELFETDAAIQHANNDIEGHDERLLVKKQLVLELHATLEKLRNLGKLEDAIKLCRAKAYWDDHRNVLRDAEQVQEEVEGRQAELAAAEKKLAEAEGAETDNGAEIAEYTQSLGVLQQQYVDAQEEARGVQKRVLEVTRQLSQHKNDTNRMVGSRNEFGVRVKTSTAEVSNRVSLTKFVYQ